MFSLINNFLIISLSKLNLIFFNNIGFYLKSFITNKFYTEFIKKEIYIINKKKLNMIYYDHKFYLFFKIKEFFYNKFFKKFF